MLVRFSPCDLIAAMIVVLNNYKDNIRDSEIITTFVQLNLTITDQTNIGIQDKICSFEGK